MRCNHEVTPAAYLTSQTAVSSFVVQVVLVPPMYFCRMRSNTRLAPSTYHRVAYCSLLRLLPVTVRFWYTHSGPALVLDPPKQAEEGFSSSVGATVAATAVVLPEVSSIQAIDIPFIQQPGGFVPGSSDRDIKTRLTAGIYARSYSGAGLVHPRQVDEVCSTSFLHLVSCTT